MCKKETRLRRINMSLNPLQLAFYKGVGGKWGALQLNPQRPHYYVKGKPSLKNYDGKFILDKWNHDNAGLTRDDMTSREGAIFLDITSAVGKNQYDWEQKVTMALSVNDIGKLLTVLEGFAGKVTIMHDPHAKSSTAGKIQKYLELASPKGLKEGCMVHVREIHTDGNNKKHSVPLSADEVCLLRTALRGFIPVALGWSY